MLYASERRNLYLFNREGAKSTKVSKNLKKGRPFGVWSVPREIEDESFYSVFHQWHIPVEKKAQFAPT